MSFDPSCGSGVCSTEAPPLIGSVLTGTGLTLAQAARALDDGRDVALTPVQREIVECWAEQQLGAAPGG